jgi:hypothetical protein
LISLHTCGTLHLEQIKFSWAQNNLRLFLIILTSCKSHNCPIYFSVFKSFTRYSLHWYLCKFTIYNQNISNSILGVFTIHKLLFLVPVFIHLVPLSNLVLGFPREEEVQLNFSLSFYCKNILSYKFYKQTHKYKMDIRKYRMIFAYIQYNKTNIETFLLCQNRQFWPNAIS